MKTHSHIIIRWPKPRSDARGLHGASVHQFSVSRWAAYLITIPLALMGVVCTVFFFSAFVALFLLAGSALGIWIWWIGRRSWTHGELKDLEGTYHVIRETQIAERTSAEAGEKNPLRRERGSHDDMS